ncbi:hypothetical protein FRC01_006708 [Tulasnella sp. 417]|nr:hypothetical protein FRC01_006708 [Tulasnella sp. 417]
MADQYPPSHHQSHHHHQHYQPPSPASSTDSRSNSSNERNPYPRNSSSSPIKPTIPPPTHHPAHSSNLDRSSTAPGNNTQGFNADAVYPPYSSSSSSHYPRPSPPPEHQVAYPSGPPGQNPSPFLGAYPYQHQPSASAAAAVLQRHLSPVHQSNSSPHPPPPSWNQHHHPSPPVQPIGIPSGPDDQVDQLADDLPPSSGGSAPAPPVISPPPSPPTDSITLTAPNVPYHPRIHYPISSPGSSDQPSSRQYSFVSLPGNAMRKRPRRKFDEIERLYSCSFPGCTKAYGTLNHLNAHVSMQRHGPKRTPGEFKDMRRARKQAQREQARAAAAREHQNEADGEDNGSPGAGPSTSPSSRTKRKIRRATEPALQVPRLPSLDDAGPSIPEEYDRIAQASRQQQQLEINRRPQSQSHIPHSIGVPTPSPPRTAPQTQPAHFQGQQGYTASPPPPATSPMHRLHQSSMLLTPLNPSHRQSYAQDSAGTTSSQPSAYGQATIGGAAGASSSGQGLPPVFELGNSNRDQAQEQRGSIQQQQHSQQPPPVVQQSAATSWDSYQGSSSYPAPGPSHRAPEPYAQPPPLGRAVGYDPSRDFYPYGGQRNVYSAAVPQSRPEAHPAAAAAAYSHPQRSISYSAPSSDPYMVPGPSQRGGEPYIPARSESYSGIPSRGDPGAAYASAPGGGRSDPYGTQRPAEQQYQTIPPPQGHIPSHSHHPGLQPQHLPSSDPAHPDPRHDPYGRGHPGPSEGPY